MSASAIHECSHGVVARELGACGIVVSLRSGPGGGGDCSFVPPPHGPTSLEDLRNELTIFVAGTVATQIAAGRSPLGPADPSEIAQNILSLEHRPEPNAREYALRQLEREFGDPIASYRALDAMSVSVLHRAVEIVKRNWTEIERLAARLESEKELVL